VAVTGKGVLAYLTAINNGRGMAKSNLYAVYFVGGQMNQEWVKQYGGISKAVDGTNITGVGERILLMCDEVTLPGYQMSIGNVPRFTGASPVAYPTGIVYNDTQLSFMCDGEMQASKFIQEWMTKLYQTTGTNKNKSYRFNYLDEFSCERMVIEKRERNSSSEVGQKTLQYNLYRAWPYSIDAVPLSYGSSQLVKVTANFYYTNWESTATPSPAILT